MKILPWLAIPVFFLALYFALPKLKDQPQTEAVPSATQGEKPSPVSDIEPVTISITPPSPLPGEPVKVNFNGLDSISKVKSLTFNDKLLAIFEEEGKLAALIGLDFHEKPASYPLILTLANDQKIESSIEVRKRELISTDFDIPEQLGGNTPQAEHELTTTLSKDSAILNSVTTQVSPEKLWNGQFRFPLKGSPVITDTYGYSRKTGSVSLSHLGTDFRAAEGTLVYAINSGMVAYAGTLRNFGETVIIDHGLGLMTLYMHLSKIKTQKDESVEKGDLIAESGSTGYSLGPHLHLSVRINGLSIDPQKFYELMGPK
jgi:murein DD-endopeptidase MepM/ murein hydrolase activator NlpD